MVHVLIRVSGYTFWLMLITPLNLLHPPPFLFIFSILPSFQKETSRILFIAHPLLPHQPLVRSDSIRVIVPGPGRGATVENERREAKKGRRRGCGDWSGGVGVAKGGVE